MIFKLAIYVKLSLCQYASTQITLLDTQSGPPQICQKQSKSNQKCIENNSIVLCCTSISYQRIHNVYSDSRHFQTKEGSQGYGFLHNLNYPHNLGLVNENLYSDHLENLYETF